MRKYSKFRMISACFMVCVRLSLFPYCRTLSAQQSYFYFSPVFEYTCLAFAIIEVLFYTVKPRPCSYPIFAKCRFIHSKGVGAYMLLKLYISSTLNLIPTVTMNKSCRFFTLDTPSLCTYHLHDRSTQQKSCEVENAVFFVFFMTQQTVAK